MEKTEFLKLAGKISDGTASEKEIAVYNRFYRAFQHSGADWDEDEMGDKKIIYKKLRQRLTGRLQPDKRNPPRIRLYWIGAAAVLLVLGLLFFRDRTGRYPGNTVAVKHDIAPGGNRAVLTLSDGRKITLTDSASQGILQNAGVSIRSTANGQLIYSVIDTYTAGRTAAGGNNFNTITTPVGGQYQVELPDGTRVWLNAASSLKFPASFTGLKSRVVELHGEAYFEVKHTRSLPFIVKTRQQEVVVLGTHFNVNDYQDADGVRTTLVKGSVLVRRNDGRFVVLKPGQQSVLKDQLVVGEADTEMVTAWKDGNFLFNDTDLREIMTQLARWYDLDLDYASIPPNRFFTGFISRDSNLSKVLEMLEVTGGMKFKIENKTIKMTENLKPM